MLLGINVDPTNPAGRPRPDLLKQAGFGAVRLVSRACAEEYAAECRTAGLSVLAIVTFASEGYVMRNADWVQVGNEMDQVGESSDTLAPAPYIERFRQVFLTERRPLVVGGLASGDVERAYPYATVVGASAYAVHPYGKNPEAARALLRDYKARYGPHLWLTEWNRPAEEIGPFLQMCHEEGVEAAFWFCWSDGMVYPFGLTAPDGYPKAEYLAMEDAMYIEERLAAFEQQLKDNGSWDEHQDKQIAYFAEILKAVMEGDYDWAKALFLALSPNSTVSLKVPVFPNP